MHKLYDVNVLVSWLYSFRKENLEEFERGKTLKIAKEAYKLRLMAKNKPSRGNVVNASTTEKLAKPGNAW